MTPWEMRIKMKIVSINVETRPQYGTCKDYFIGVFDDEINMKEAITRAESKYRDYQHIVSVTDVVLNYDVLTMK